MHTQYLLFLFLTFFSCHKDQTTSPEKHTISGKAFNKTVLIDGYNNDNLIIENCIFENIEGDGLQIRNVDNLIIRDCLFRNINGNAIRFRNSGSSDNVLIEKNKIYNITYNGILGFESHKNTSIIDNLIYNIGTDELGNLAGSPHHGIYFQGPNFRIKNNSIYDVINSNGNCISVRSYGTISGNTLFNAAKHGISYYSDHPGLDGQLLIENNIIYDNYIRGVNLQTDGTTSNHIQNAIIRFNTIITSIRSCVGISSGMSDISVKVYGNILIRTDGGTNYIYFNNPIFASQNLESSVDIGFVNYNKRDLHINSTSEAINFAVGLSKYPTTDIDGDRRWAATLDAGADEKH